MAARITKKPRAKKPPRFETAADLFAALGGIPPERVRLDPPPGTATERDLLRGLRESGRLLELFDGTLVEKPMGRPEAYLALELGRLLANFVVEHNLGFCTGADDLIRILPKQVRGPDTTFTSWLKRPDGTVDRDQISKVIPDLTVEVLSPKNTPAEIARKIDEYFRGGVRAVWVVDHRKETATVYTAPDAAVVFDSADYLDGGDILPGFRLPLAELFARVKRVEAAQPAEPEPAAKPAKKGRRKS